MKRIFLIFTLLSFAITSLYADEQKNVIFTNEHTEERITLNSLCNIFLKMELDENEVAHVSFSLENLSEDKKLILFDRSYNEKVLKKQTPKIKFDKRFVGDHGTREIEPFRNWENRSLEILGPSDKKQFSTKTLKNGEKIVLRLPIYIARPKNKSFFNWHSSRLYLLQKETIEIVLQFKLKPDENLIRIARKIDSLKKSLEANPFCIHKDHLMSLQEQERPFKKEMSEIMEDIDNILWEKGGKNIHYESLKEELLDIDLSKYTTENCGVKELHKHEKKVYRPTTMSCPYCAKSLQSLYHLLDDYYTAIYNSTDRISSKRKNMTNVEQIFKCCSTHKKHISDWKNGGFYKNKIEKRYNDIKNL